MEQHETHDSSDDATHPPKRQRLRLQTAGDVRREIARVYREGKAGRRDVAEVSRLANVLSILNRAIESSELEHRIERLEQRGAQDGE